MESYRKGVSIDLVCDRLGSWLAAAIIELEKEMIIRNVEFLEYTI